LESSWILFCATVSVSIALLSNEIGYGMATHLILFSSGRFCFELMRGDTARQYWGIFSEAQWLSLGMICGVMIAEILLLLPFHIWHITIGSCLIVFAIFVAVASTWPSYNLQKPGTIQEISRSLSLLEKSRSQGLSGQHAVHLRKIHPDLQISDGIFEDANTQVHHYTLSYIDRNMPHRDAFRLVKLIQSWHPRKEKSKLIHHYKNTFHFLRYQTTESG
jgi:hypothetical protein